MRIEKDLEIALAVARGILKGAELDEKNETYIYELLKVYHNFDKLKEVIKRIKSNAANEP